MDMVSSTGARAYFQFIILSDRFKFSAKKTWFPAWETISPVDHFTINFWPMPSGRTISPEKKEYIHVLLSNMVFVIIWGFPPQE